MRRIGLLFGLITFSQLAYAGNFGFTASPFGTYQGQVEIFNGQDTSLDVSGIPYSLFVESQSLRIQYLHYEQFGTDEFDDGTITGRGSVHVENDALTIGFPIAIEIENGLSAFGYGGVGIIRSRASAELAASNGSDVIGVSGNLSSKNNFDIGFVAGGGVKKTFDDHAFVGVEITLILGQSKLGGANDSEANLNLSGLLIGLTTGVSF